MTASLMSIRPRFADEIFAGRKIFELRRRRFKAEKGHLLYVYESAPTMAVTGVVQVARVDVRPLANLWTLVRNGAGVSRNEFDEYFRGCREGTAIALGPCFAFDDPLDLSSLRQRVDDFHPPQSWMSFTALPVSIGAALKRRHAKALRS